MLIDPELRNILIDVEDLKNSFEAEHIDFLNQYVKRKNPVI